MSRNEIKRWVLLTAIAGPACVFASLVFPPFLLLGVAVSAAGGLGLTIGYSRSTGRWYWAALASVSVVVFIASAMVCFAFWGQSFSLADQNNPVPVAIQVVIAASGAFVLLALATFAVLVALVASRASRRVAQEAGAS